MRLGKAKDQAMCAGETHEKAVLRNSVIFGTKIKGKVQLLKQNGPKAFE